MRQTKPIFIIKKYRSILRAAIAVEAVNFIISLTDSIIAGNAVSAEAFAAIGLIAPFIPISIFLSSIVDTGTVLKFSYHVGKYEKEKDDSIFIYDFTVNAESAVEIASQVEERLREASVSPASSALAGMITEDMLMVIKEKNAPSKKPLFAECTIIGEDEGVRVIFRDSGMVFDITDTDSEVDSFRQYIVSNLMLNQDRKLYLTTTGYNRNELFFSK